MTALPSYVDVEAWGAFLEMRQALPKSVPFTPRAQLLIIKRLMKFHNDGWDVNASLEMSAIKGWRDVYAVEKIKVDQPDARDPAILRAEAQNQIATQAPAFALALKQKLKAGQL